MAAIFKNTELSKWFDEVCSELTADFDTEAPMGNDFCGKGTCAN